MSFKLILNRIRQKTNKILNKITGKDYKPMYSHILNLDDEFKIYKKYCNLNEDINKEVRDKNYQKWADEVKKKIIQSDSMELENFKRYIIQTKRNDQALNPVPGAVVGAFFGGFGVSLLTDDKMDNDYFYSYGIIALMIIGAIIITSVCCCSAIKTSHKDGFYDDIIEVIQVIIDKNKS